MQRSSALFRLCRFVPCQIVFYPLFLLLSLCSTAAERRFVTLASANAPRALSGAHQQRRYKSGLPANFGVVFVPQQEAWIVERMGKYLKVLEPVRLSLFTMHLLRMIGRERFGRIVTFVFR